MSTSTPPTLNLDAGRTIALHAGKAIVTFHCRRITAEDWKTYYNAIVIKATRIATGLVNEVDIDSACLVLVDRVLEKVEGFKVEGGADLLDLPNWKDRVPLRFRVALGRVLGGVRGVPAGDDTLVHPDGEEVFLDAPWSVGPDGGLQSFTGLRHLLKAPSAEQFRRFSAAASSSTVIGGRSGVTVYPNTSEVLVALYDELVLSVDPAYVSHGEPLSDREQIVAFMDYSHKVAAAQEVLSSLQGVSTVKEQAKK